MRFRGTIMSVKYRYFSFTLTRHKFTLRPKNRFSVYRQRSLVLCKINIGLFCEMRYRLYCHTQTQHYSHPNVPHPSFHHLEHTQSQIIIIILDSFDLLFIPTWTYNTFMPFLAENKWEPFNILKIITHLHAPTYTFL